MSWPNSLFDDEIFEGATGAVKQALMYKRPYLTEDDTAANFNYHQRDKDSQKSETVSSLDKAMSELLWQLNAIKQHIYIAKTKMHEICTQRQIFGSNEAVLQKLCN